MVKDNKSPTLSQQPVKNVAKPLKGPYAKLADFAESTVHISPNDDKYAKESSASQSPEILSRSDLISALGQIWDCASRSLAHLQPKASFGYSGTVCEKDNDSHYLVGTSGFHTINFIDSGSLHVDLNTPGYFSCIVQQSLTFIRATRRLHCKPINDHVIDDIFWQSGDDSSIKHDIWLKENRLINVETLYLMKRYEILAQITLWPKPPMFVSTEAKKIVEAFIPRASDRHICPVSGNEASSSNTKTRNLDTSINTPNLKHLSSGGIDKVHMLRKDLSSFLHTRNILHKFPNKNFAASMTTAVSLGLHLDAHVSTAAPVCTYEANQLDIEDDHLLEDEVIKCEKFIIQDEHQSERCSLVTNKPHPLLAKKEHAVSGALAGIFVSLCLHPVDTVKTIVQSCHPGQKSICFIGQSVLSERGLPGLYRGITSNVTSSAPISAIYTFTYESVKEFLLPSLPKVSFFTTFMNITLLPIALQVLLQV